MVAEERRTPMAERMGEVCSQAVTDRRPARPTDQALSILEPGMMALEMFDHIPSWAIAHAVHDDRTAPLLFNGEIAVIESDGATGITPMRGGLYLMECITPPVSGRRERRSCEIIQARESPATGSWYAHAYRSVGGRAYAADGPYRDQAALADKLIGRVVGIYAPSCRGRH